MPEPLKNKPELDPETHWYLDTYFMLNPSRQMSDSRLGYIPLSEITDFYNHYDTLHDREVFTKIIVAIDAEYVKEINEKARKNTQAKR